MSTSDEVNENGVPSEIGLAGSPESKPESETDDTVMDLSMKKRPDPGDHPGRPADGDAVKVELIPSAFEVKINQLIINADKKNNGVSDDGDADDSKSTNKRSKRTKKRKQPPEKIIQGHKENSDYVIETEQPQQEQEDVETTELIIDSAELAPESSIQAVTSDGEIVRVETVLEVEADETDTEEPTLPLKVPNVTVASSAAAATDLSQSRSPLLSASFVDSNGKSMRPFKLYTQNRDLLAGIALSQNNMDTLAAALSGRPNVPPSSIVGSTASLPVTAFAPLSVKNPLLPTTIPTGVPATTISQVGSTAVSNGSRISVETTVIPTPTPSAMRLMTLATEADKILKEKKQGKGESLDKNVSSVPLLISTSDAGGQAVGHLQEDGTIEITLDTTSQERLALIQQHMAATPDQTEQPSRKKLKKREQLPETLKTPGYWERRRKNNEAAKRSRDARRAKEDQIAIRAAILEHENTRLKIELQALKEETAQLRAEIYERKKADSK